MILLTFQIFKCVYFLKYQDKVFAYNFWNFSFWLGVINFVHIINLVIDSAMYSYIEHR